MSYKDLDAQLSDENKDLIITKLREIEALLPFAIKVSPKERIALTKMGKKTVGFVESTLKYAKTQPQILPVYLDMEKKKEDMELFVQMEEVMSILGPIYEKMRDTSMVAGAEAYHSARVIYDSVKLAVKSGQPGSEVIYKELAANFKRGKYTPSDPPKDQDPPVNQEPTEELKKLAG